MTQEITLRPGQFNMRTIEAFADNAFRREGDGYLKATMNDDGSVRLYVSKSGKGFFGSIFGSWRKKRDETAKVLVQAMVNSGAKRSEAQAMMREYASSIGIKDAHFRSEDVYGAFITMRTGQNPFD